MQNRTVTQFTDAELNHEFLVKFVTRGMGLSSHCEVHSFFPAVGQSHVLCGLSRQELVDAANQRHRELVERGTLLRVEVLADDLLRQASGDFLRLR